MVAQLTQLDWNLRYWPRNDSGNDSKLERRVINEAEVRSRRYDHSCCLQMMLVAQLRAGVDGMVLWRCHSNEGRRSCLLTVRWIDMLIDELSSYGWGKPCSWPHEKGGSLLP